MGTTPTVPVIPGTSITQTSMEKMLLHNRSITEGASQVPRLKVTRSEGVQGTSPTPGQDHIDYVPPTTSNVTLEDEPTQVEREFRDMATLFPESEAPDDEDEDENPDDPDDKKDAKDKDKDKDGKDKPDEKDDEPVEEAVEVHCNECGYEETYDLSESNIAEGNVPLTAENKLDTTCPMCGANMDLSMVGATNVNAVTDPNPFTGLTGESQQVSQESVDYANELMERVISGEQVDVIATSVFESDFLKRRRKPEMALA